MSTDAGNFAPNATLQIERHFNYLPLVTGIHNLYIFSAFLEERLMRQEQNFLPHGPRNLRLNLTIT